MLLESSTFSMCYHNGIILFCFCNLWTCNLPFTIALLQNKNEVYDWFIINDDRKHTLQWDKLYGQNPQQLWKTTKEYWYNDIKNKILENGEVGLRRLC